MPKQTLFQTLVIKNHLKTQDQNALIQAYDKFTHHFHNPSVQANIKQSKEEQYQEGFLRDLFVNILGYTLNPTDGYNLTTELKNLKNAKKCDGAILKDTKALAVIELKGMDTTDLSRIESQAFGYKNNHPTCRYVITSNFQKLRFYMDNAVDFIEFDLFTLDFERFSLLFLLLYAKNLLNDLPMQLKSESISQEEKITKQLYKDYSKFKLDLFDNICKHNGEHDTLLLFGKTQKLLDRLLFIFFAEDIGLLPANIAHNLLKEWQIAKSHNIPISIYGHLKNYFNYLNTGYKTDKFEIFAYNGGLFKPDDILDNLTVCDDILYHHIKKLADYDFNSEIDVNILGHIFENSLTQIDEIKAKIQGEPFDNSVSKRKKDGVFYTPKYITQYIVANTVGKLCEHKKQSLSLIDDEYTPNRHKKTQEKLFQILQDYRRWLLSITICDPACGSGAFLNEALNFLIGEHHYIDELESKLTNSSIHYQNVANHILEHNLFGVDINAESVEIAKLALWLRTAQPHRKLSNLNENIKCGNSLIDNPDIAGDKAFDWQKQFPKVFEKGGFDVVIGNPPYVKLEQIKSVSEQLEKLNFQTFEKRGDLYVLFVEQGFNLLKNNGLISYIMPNKWLQAGYGKSLRQYFLQKNLVQLIDFGDFQIFEGVTTYPCIFIAEKNLPNETLEIAVLKSNIKDDFVKNINDNLQVFNHNQFDENTWVISSNKDKNLLEKLEKSCLKLKDFINGDAYYGVKTGLSEAFFIDKSTKNAMDNSSQSYIFPFLQGRDIERYATPNHSNYLIGTFPAFKLNIDELPSIKNHLLSFGQERLEQNGLKGSRKKTSNKWFETQDAIAYYEIFAKPKIMYQAFQVSPCFIYDEQGLYCNNSMWVIPTNNKGLLAILNSKMGWWLISKYCTQIQNGYQLIWKYFGEIPIPSNSEVLTELTDLMLSLNQELQHIQSKFLRRLQDNFNLDKLPKRLESFWELGFADFVKELKKQKVHLSLQQQDDWEEYFDAYKKDIVCIQSKINQTDDDINQMVYRLYGINDDEIQIIERV